MKMATVKLKKTTKTYLLSYTIFKNKSESNSSATDNLRRDFKIYIDTLNSKQIFETTYLIKSVLPCRKLYEKIKLKINALINGNQLANEVDIKLGVFEINTKNSYTNML